MLIKQLETVQKIQEEQTPRFQKSKSHTQLPKVNSMFDSFSRNLSSAVIQPYQNQNSTESPRNRNEDFVLNDITNLNLENYNVEKQNKSSFNDYEVRLQKEDLPNRQVLTRIVSNSPKREFLPGVPRKPSLAIFCPQAPTVGAKTNKRA